jgi:alpha-tubulin suppressor-like RCC1 family protein
MRTERNTLAFASLVVAACAIACETVRVRPEATSGPEPAAAEGETAEAVPELAAPRVRAIGVGAALFHSCALLEGGAVECWGQNVDGVVDGSDEAGRAFAPTRVPGVEGATSLHVVRNASCVRSGESDLRCWGAGVIGRPWNGGVRPMRVRFANVSDVAFGAKHACGRDDAGRVHCIGRNDEGQRAHELGRWASGSRPSEVDALEGIRGIATGRVHTCALLASGGVKCFGANTEGQLGNETVEFRTFSPKDVEGLDDAVEIAAHPDGLMTCARRRGGEVVCWGSRGSPQDDGGLALVGRTPAALPPLPEGESASGIEVGLWEVCALTEDGGLWCWSESLESVRGEEDAPPFGPPRRTDALPPVVELALGVGHACARTEAGHVLCWGENDYAQLGDGTTEARDAPVVVAIGGAGS